MGGGAAAAPLICPAASGHQETELMSKQSVPPERKPAVLHRMGLLAVLSFIRKARDQRYITDC